MTTRTEMPRPVAALLSPEALSYLRALLIAALWCRDGPGA